jgi:hypothetical protein
MNGSSQEALTNTPPATLHNSAQSPALVGKGLAAYSGSGAHRCVTQNTASLSHHDDNHPTVRVRVHSLGRCGHV